MNDKLINAIEKINLILSQEVCDKRNLPPGLMTELGGGCMFFFYHAKVFNNDTSYEKAYAILDRIIDMISYLSKAEHFTFCNGLAGIGWMINHLEKNDFIEFDDNDILSDFDETLSNYLFKELARGNYDFLHGGMGAFNYFINRNQIPENQNTLIKAVEILDSIKSKHSSGIYWDFFNGVENVIERKNANLGLSHGVPSILAVLANLQSVVPNEATRGLIVNSANFILETKNKDIKYSLYPYTFKIDKPEEDDSRLGWCYGDLGIALSLLAAGNSINDGKYRSEAIKIMKHSATRKSFRENQITDAALCHGTSGIAQIFKRFYFETGDPIFNESSNYWIGHTLDLLVSRQDLKTSMTRWDNKLGYVDCYGLLEGISGVGLSLLSATSDTPLSWDEVLLIS